MPEKLLKCPFCGEQPVRRQDDNCSQLNWLICSNINCNGKPRTGNYITKDLADVAWNRRAERKASTKPK